jgi:hypothetical protein
MSHTVSGSCHCGNLGYELATDVPVGEIRARACGCRFCRIHGSKNWSDASGKATIRVRDPASLQRYRFGLRTADFMVCRICGAYLGAVVSDEEGGWSSLNLRLSELKAVSAPVDYEAETAPQRLARRKAQWTPTFVMVG